ncbi:MAG TPA: hypothetical protein DCS75_03050 [Gemmatimonadetes bacterium]|nr:hypothetical protein [Gemmatimonadota bacterium]HAT37445.1 hypothetical protein [Gemmatimonadota bacterium]
MTGSSIRSIVTFVLGVALMGIPSSLEAQADFAGSWTLSVTTDNGVTNPSLNLQQDGVRLTGRYSSEALGEQNVRGLVDGNDVMIRFNASVQGQSIPVVYRGTLDADGRLTGTIVIADGMLSGTFTATRQRP